MTPREIIASWVKDSLSALDCADSLIRGGHIDDRPDIVIRLDNVRTELEDIYKELTKEVKG